MGPMLLTNKDTDKQATNQTNKQVEKQSERYDTKKLKTAVKVKSIIVKKLLQMIS